jgi:gliding motility-associated-like protein
MRMRKYTLLLAGILFSHIAGAQLCNGSLGDPVVNITFGSGPNPGPPLSAASTFYTYVNNACPVNGYYTVLSSGVECNYAWHVLPKDHTGDKDGYFMLVDASFEPNDFYVDTVRGLCANTTYEFAAWMLNMKNIQQGIRPNITFTIETTTGQVLQSYNSGDVPPEAVPLWRQYGFYFTTTVPDIVLRMKNNADGGDGNDLALDDITFRPCGPKVSVNIGGSLNSKTICKGDTSSLTFSSTIVGGYANPSYQWQKSVDSMFWTDIPGATGNSYTTAPPAAPGNYFFRLAVAEGSNIFLPTCRIASQTFLLTVEPLPVPAPSNSGPVCEGAAITLTAAGDGAYSWTGANNFTSNDESPVITNVSLSDSGKYYVTVTSTGGCTNSDSTFVKVNKRPVISTGDNKGMCKGGSVVLKGFIPADAPPLSWSWSPAESLDEATTPAPVASPAVTTLYVLTVSDGVCSNSDSILVTVHPPLTANAGPDKVIVGNEFVVLDGQVSTYSFSYYWSPEIYLTSPSSLSPQTSPPFDMQYVLHAVSNEGCGEVTDTVQVKYYKAIYIPSAFSPNNDRLNDTWNIPSLAAFPLAEIKVYNRFGQLVFDGKGNTKQWDGRFRGSLLTAGAYSYTVDLKNGNKILSGIVMIVR